MSQDIRVALVGYGLGGRSFHMPMITATTGLRLTTVVTSSAARASEATRDVPGVRVLADSEALWARAADVDLVVISTPNRTHVPLALAALDAGLPVVMDKPIAATVADARRLVAAARERGLFLSVYQNRRYDGDFRTLRTLISNGSLGRVHRFESRFERWRPVPKPGWRESPAPEDAGGILYDLGTHLIDQALVLFGPVTAVYAEVRALRQDVITDDDVFVALTHASGVQSHLWASMLVARQGARLRALGSAGTYTKFGMDPQEDALRRGGRPGGADWGTEPPEQWGMLDDGTESLPVPTARGAYQDYYAAVVASLRDGAPPPVLPDDAVATLRVVEAARESARTGVIAVPGD